MNEQLIFILIVGLGATITRGDEIDNSEEMTYQLERNSSYVQRQWNISLLGEKIGTDEHHIEDCLLKFAPKQSEYYSKGPLCEICSQAITIKFTANETITLRYASFTCGILTFPESQDEILIDVVLCSYDPNVGIGRFYLTRGKEVNSVHFIKTVGSKDDKYKFILDSNEVTLEDRKTK